MSSFPFTVTKCKTAFTAINKLNRIRADIPTAGLATFIPGVYILARQSCPLPSPEKQTHNFFLVAILATPLRTFLPAFHLSFAWIVLSIPTTYFLSFLFFPLNLIFSPPVPPLGPVPPPLPPEGIGQYSFPRYSTHMVHSLSGV
jgi:hypothetical protein